MYGGQKTEEVVNHKKEENKIWLKEKTEENLICYKCAKKQCKKVIAKAKKVILDRLLPKRNLRIQRFT